VTIIVVDDEPAIVRMCVQVLQSKGHTVHGITRATRRSVISPPSLPISSYRRPYQYVPWATGR